MRLNTRHFIKYKNYTEKLKQEGYGLKQTKPLFRQCPVYRNVAIFTLTLKSVEVGLPGGEGSRCHRAHPVSGWWETHCFAFWNTISISISWTSQGSGIAGGVCILHFWCPFMAPLLSNYGPSNCRWHGMNHFSPFSLLRHKMQMSASDLKLCGFFVKCIIKQQG